MAQMLSQLLESRTLADSVQVNTPENWSCLPLPRAYLSRSLPAALIW